MAAAFNRPIQSIYKWKIADGYAQQRLSGNGRQAAVSLRNRRENKKNSNWESELFVCKSYAVAGKHVDAKDGSKYAQREAATLRNIEHPNIVRYVDFEYTSLGFAQIYLEWCAGGDLDDYVRQNGALGYEQAADVLNQLAQALLYIHHGIRKYQGVLELAKPIDADALVGSQEGPASWQSLLHRDVKPENGTCHLLIVTWSRFVLIVHSVFIASQTGSPLHVKLGDFGIARPDTKGTQTYIGTPKYKAPV